VTFAIPLDSAYFARPDGGASTAAKNRDFTVVSPSGATCIHFVQMVSGGTGNESLSLTGSSGTLTELSVQGSATLTCPDGSQTSFGLDALNCLNDAVSGGVPGYSEVSGTGTSTGDNDQVELLGAKGPLYNCQVGYKLPSGDAGPG
jgi:hypothetical protein